MSSMGILNVEETIRFFKSYGYRVDEDSVKEWVKENNMKVSKSCKKCQVVEEDIYRYNDWLMAKGTPYEEGIDDKTKIARLEEEVAMLKKEVEQLKNEKSILEDQLGNTAQIWE